MYYKDEETLVEKKALLAALTLVASAAVLSSALRAEPAKAIVNHGARKAPAGRACSTTNPCLSWTNFGSGVAISGTASSNTGLLGQSTSGLGVFGASSSGNGVQGNSTSGIGAYGQSSSNYGLYGSSNATYGVYGSGASGVAGVSNAGAGTVGTSTSSYGVYGNSSSGTGVYGISGSGAGLVGTSAASVALSVFNHTEIQAIQAGGGTSNDPNGFSLAAFESNGNPTFWVDNAGNAHVAGLIYTQGSCKSGCDASRGRSVVSYAAQTSEPTLEDFGRGIVSNGRARVRINQSFENATAGDASYMVFLSPEGPNRGLYVTGKTPAGFTVAEDQSGRSNLEFSYRIVARPYEAKGARLPITSANEVPRFVTLRNGHPPVR